MRILALILCALAGSTERSGCASAAVADEPPQLVSEADLDWRALDAPRCLAYSAAETAFACLALDHTTTWGWEYISGVRIVKATEQTLLPFKDEDNAEGSRRELAHPQQVLSLDTINAQLSEQGFVAVTGHPVEVRTSRWYEFGGERGLALRVDPPDEEDSQRISLRCSSEELVIYESNGSVRVWVQSEVGARDHIVLVRDTRSEAGEMTTRFVYTFVDGDALCARATAGSSP